MKFKIKRILAVMLVFCMMMGLVPNMLMTAHAAGTEITEAELFEQIEFTSAMIDGSSIVNSNSSAFTKTNGTGWELKYSQSGTVLYFDLYLDNANINQVNFTGKLLKDSAYNVSFTVHVKGNCSINGLYVEISHTDPKYQFGGEMANYSNMDVNIYYDSHNSTLDASNYIQLKGMYYVRLRVDNNGHTGNTLKCNYFDVQGTNWLSRIDMHGVNFVATRSGTGVVFNVYNCGIYFTNCNVLFNLAENVRPFQDGNNKIEFSNEMVEYGGKVERIHVGIPGAEADYVDSNRYAAILKSENLAKYLKFTNQTPAMPSGNTETDITAILGNTETYQFNNAALPNWLAEGGFNIYRNGSLYKGSNIMPIESVANGNSDAIKVNHTFDEAGTYKLVEALTLKYFNDPVDNFVDAHNGYKKNTFNITTTEGSSEGGGEETAEIDLVNVTVTEPVANAEAVFDATEDHDGCSITDGKISWMKDGTTEVIAGEKFASNTTYRCFVALSAEDGYKFTSDTKVYINDKEATYVRHADGYAHYYYNFTTGVAEGGEDPEPVEVVITKDSLKAGKVDSFYLDPITSTPDGNKVTLVSGTLPAGIELQENGNVIGRPTEAGTFTFTVKVAAMDGEEELGSATKQYTLVIEGSGEGGDEVTVTITTESLPNGKVNENYYEWIVADPAGYPYTFTLEEGTLPAGVELVGDSGALVGEPTEAGTYTFTVKATAMDNDVVVGSAAKQFTLVIEGSGSEEGGEDPEPVEVVITKDSLKAGKVGKFYMDGITSTPAGNTVTLESGKLPAGIELQENGNVIGTPTEAGTFTFTVKATASGGEYATKQYTLVIEGDGSGEGGETPEHVHNWAEDWSKDDTHHWHECLAEDCDVTENAAKDGYAEHEYVDGVCACGKEKPVVEAPAVELNKDTLALVVPNGEKLIATVTPEGLEGYTLVWSSSDASVATVDQDGNVTAVAAGTATITVELQIGATRTTISDTCVVTVTEESDGGDVTPECDHADSKLTLKYEDETGHWSECECGDYKTDKVSHVFESDEDTNCDCGYTRTVEDEGDDVTPPGDDDDDDDVTPPADDNDKDDTDKPEDNKPTKPEEDKLDKVPETGDNTNIFMWLVVMMLSACGIAGLGIYKKRRA